MNILAVDPGLVTGFALLTEGGVRPTIWQAAGRAAAYKDGHRVISTERPMLVVERFTIQPRNTNSPQLDALYVIGALEAFSLQFGCDWVFQRPSDAVGVTSPYSNRVLKALGWYVPGAPHGLDATRHLAHFLLHQYQAEADKIAEAMLHG